MEILELTKPHLNYKFTLNVNNERENVCLKEICQKVELLNELWINIKKMGSASPRECLFIEPRFITKRLFVYAVQKFSFSKSGEVFYSLIGFV